MVVLLVVLFWLIEEGGLDEGRLDRLLFPPHDEPIDGREKLREPPLKLLELE